MPRCWAGRNGVAEASGHPVRQGAPRHTAAPSKPDMLATRATAARPDHGVGLTGLIVEQVGEDRAGETRIVELDREVVAAFFRPLGPRRPDLDSPDIDAMAGRLVARVTGSQTTGPYLRSAILLIALRSPTSCEWPRLATSFSHQAVQHATRRPRYGESGRRPAAPRSPEPQRPRLDFLPLGFAHSSRGKKVSPRASSAAPGGALAGLH
jgi:hypothetical protein